MNFTDYQPTPLPVITLAQYHAAQEQFRLEFEPDERGFSKQFRKLMAATCEVIAPRETIAADLVGIHFPELVLHLFMRGIKQGRIDAAYQPLLLFRAQQTRQSHVILFSVLSQYTTLTKLVLAEVRRFLAQLPFRYPDPLVGMLAVQNDMYLLYRGSMETVGKISVMEFPEFPQQLTSCMGVVVENGESHVYNDENHRLLGWGTSIAPGDSQRHLYVLNQLRKLHLLYDADPSHGEAAG